MSQYVHVPIEPTPEMIHAMQTSMYDDWTVLTPGSIEWALWVQVWKAALRAAPQDVG